MKEKSSERCWYYLLMLLPLLSACVSSNALLKNQLKVVEALQESDYPQAKQTMEGSENAYRPEDAVLLHLDRGMVYFYLGDDRPSNIELQQADQLDEMRYGERTDQQIAAAITNDNAMDYRAQDFESIYLNVFGALNYARENSLEDARVEIRRMQEKLLLYNDRHQSEIASFTNESNWQGEDFSKEKLPFHNSALGRYLAMVFERADQSPDDFRISGEELQSAFALQAGLYPFASPPLPRYQQTGQVAVNVVAFVGLAPAKYEEQLRLLRVPGGLQIEVQSQQQQEGLFIPLPDSQESAEFRYYQFSLPRLRDRGSKVTRVVLEVDGGKQTLELLQLEDISRIALANFEAKWPFILTRNALRIFTKVLLNEATAAAIKTVGKSSDNGGLSLLGSFFGALGSVAVSASEGADLRGGGFFPSRSLVGELWLDPGVYRFALAYYQEEQLLLRRELGERRVEKGLNLLQDAFLK